MKPPKNNFKNRKDREAASSSSSYLAEDENFQKFAAQLARLGLELRDITGDGNCCFRALSDQMHGTEAHHMEYRKRVCQYMRNSREEFEPFVAALIDDDEVSGESGSGVGGASADSGGGGRKIKFMSKKLDAYERYIKNLEQPGTYADNGCLVAFARLYQVNINIHQLNMPIWTISGVATMATKAQPRELHLSYHNGEHYSSIRPIGDRTNTPANILITQNNINHNSENFYDAACASFSISSRNNKNNKNFDNNVKNKQKSGSFCYNTEYNEYDEYSQYDDGSSSVLPDFNNKVDEIIEITKCMDINMIKEKLAEHNYDTEQTINYFINQRNLEEWRNDNENDADDDENDEQFIGKQQKSRPLSKIATKSGSDKKMEKKMRQMERQRLKAIEQQQEKEVKKHQQQQKSAQVSSRNDYPQQFVQQADDFNISISNIQTKSI